MNFPGQGEGWWEWRLRPAQLDPDYAPRLTALGRLFDRAPPRPGG
jgi:4-alpha-glucanotransferase